MSARRPTLVLALIFSGALLLAGCSSGPTPDAAAGEVGIEEVTLPDCTEFSAWRDAQDALDLDDAAEATLDDDGDGIACNDLADQEYAGGWGEAYPEACEAVFIDSTSGSLFDSSGTEYTPDDCTFVDPGPDSWEGDSASEPADDGRNQGWQAVCDSFIGEVVADDLRESDEVYVTQDDCALQNPY